MTDLVVYPDDITWLVGAVNHLITTGQVPEEVKEMVKGIKDGNPQANRLIGQIAEVVTRLGDATPVAKASIIVRLMERVAKNQPG